MNYCVNLLRKVKKDYYANLKLKYITDNKKFFNTVDPFFSGNQVKHYAN